MTDWNAVNRLAGRLPGVSLNAQGRRDGEALAARLATVPLRHIVSSPLERAQETAALIARRHDLAVATDEAFTERAYAVWQGLLSSEIRAQFPEDVCAVAEGGTVTGVEPVDAMAARMLAGVERLAASHAGEAVVVVSHADPVRALVAHIIGMPAASLRAIPVDTASLSRLRRRDGAFVLDYLNSLSHLARRGAGELSPGATSSRSGSPPGRRARRRR